MTRAEMEALGWDALDVLLVSGDAYVDHPSFATALLGRTLVAHGFRTGVITQPRWSDAEDLLAMGRPLLFAGVSAGAIDSMLAHYTAFRKKHFPHRASRIALLLVVVLGLYGDRKSVV